MASTNRHVPVKMVRIQLPDRKLPITHTNATVGILEHADTNTAYLRINSNGQVIVSEELHNFKWLEQSCSDGVTTIDSSSSKIIIIYNAKDEACRNLFAKMRTLLQGEPPNEPRTSNSSQNIQTPKDSMTLAIADLVNGIQTGDSANAEHAARYLAQAHPQCQFRLVSPNENHNKTVIKKPSTQLPPDAFRLKLQIECHLNREPLISSIYVHAGSNLRALKEQIEDRTGIKCKDQYWYAMDRYLISDEYVFGSSEPVVPPLRRNAPTKQEKPPTDPIRSGDTLILYIAQLPPCEK